MKSKIRAFLSGIEDLCDVHGLGQLELATSPVARIYLERNATPRSPWSDADLLRSDVSRVAADLNHAVDVADEQDGQEEEAAAAVLGDREPD